MTRSLWKIKSSFYHLLRRNPLSAFILRRENKGIQSLLKELPARSVLDIGSGRGNSLALLLNFTALVTAVDHVPGMVRKTKEIYPGLKFIAAEAQFLPFRDCSFDLVSCIGVMEYINDWSIPLQEMHRVLSPVGYAVLTYSPPGLLTYLRLLLGHRLYTSTDKDFRKILDASAAFSISRYNRTLLQHQYLLKRKA
jgi:ubiquinone/menaquinone biosynthesis C-methylase UbiE